MTTDFVDGGRYGGGEDEGTERASERHGSLSKSMQAVEICKVQKRVTAWASKVELALVKAEKRRRGFR